MTDFPEFKRPTKYTDVETIATASAMTPEKKEPREFLINKETSTTIKNKGYYSARELRGPYEEGIGERSGMIHTIELNAYRELEEANKRLVERSVRAESTLAKIYKHSGVIGNRELDAEVFSIVKQSNPTMEK